MQELKGKNAFVTGGSRGIGKAIATKLAQEGANVVITYSKSSEAADALVKELEKLGVKGLALQADARQVENVIKAVDQAVKEFGPIDILVNNAGIFEMAPLPELSLEDFDRTFNVNVRAVFASTSQAIKSMPEGGRIITIGSVNAHRMPFPGGSLYSMSKAAVAAMTKAWGRDLGEKNITANVIHPGPIDTDMNPADGQFGETLSNMTALKRYGKTEEIAELALFLASPRSNYMTGSELTIDGGFVI